MKECTYHNFVASLYSISIPSDLYSLGIVVPLIQSVKANIYFWLPW